MLGFFIGLLVGGFIGISMMAILSYSRNDEIEPKSNTDKEADDNE